MAQKSLMLPSRGDNVHDGMMTSRYQSAVCEPLSALGPSTSQRKESYRVAQKHAEAEVALFKYGSRTTLVVCVMTAPSNCFKDDAGLCGSF